MLSLIARDLEKSLSIENLKEDMIAWQSHARVLKPQPPLIKNMREFKILPIFKISSV